MTVAAANINRFQRAGVGLKSGSQHNDVKLVEILGGLDAGLGNLSDGLAIFDINELHVVAVKGFVVTVIQRRSLGKQRVTCRRQQLDQLRVLHFFRNFGSNEI